jgi:hypothetical protein
MYDKIEVARQPGQLMGQQQVLDRGEILCTLDNMDSLLGEMESNIEELTDRIDAVLVPISPVKEAGITAAPQSSPLAQTLFTRNERLSYFNRRLRELSGRVQL